MESRLSDIHKVKFINYKKHQLPILSWFIEGGDKSTYDEISQKLESLGWLVPYSEVLFDGQTVNCFRIVIKTYLYRRCNRGFNQRLFCFSQINKVKGMFCKVI